MDLFCPPLHPPTPAYLKDREMETQRDLPSSGSPFKCPWTRPRFNLLSNMYGRDTHTCTITCCLPGCKQEAPMNQKQIPNGWPKYYPPHPPCHPRSCFLSAKAQDQWFQSVVKNNLETYQMGNISGPSSDLLNQQLGGYAPESCVSWSLPVIRVHCCLRFIAWVALPNRETA